MEIVRVSPERVQPFDRISHYRNFTKATQRTETFVHVLQQLPPRHFKAPIPVFYQVARLDAKNGGPQKVAADLEDFAADKKLLVEASTTPKELKSLIRRHEKFSSKELLLLFAGDALIKGNLDVGTLQQIYGDYRDGWLYITVVRTGH